MGGNQRKVSQFAPASETIEKLRIGIRNDVKQEIRKALADRESRVVLPYTEDWLLAELKHDGYDVDGAYIWLGPRRPPTPSPTETWWGPNATSCLLACMWCVGTYLASLSLKYQ